LQLKPNSSLISSGCLELACQLYGGGIWQTWFDRDLGISGKVVIKRSDKVEIKVVSIKKPLFNIPTLCIHFLEDRYSNFRANPEKHLRAIVATSANSSDSPSQGHSPYIMKLIADECNCKLSEIVGVDLRLCDVQPAAILGVNKDRICGQGIDNLNGTFCALQALINSSKNLANEKNIRLVTVFDHEEVGSGSFTGADSCILRDLLKRILTAIKVHENSQQGMICKGQGLAIAIRKSFCISVDNAHAVHPNYSEVSEARHDIQLNNGPVFKINCKQRYATECEGEYIVEELAKQAEIPFQKFVCRQDLPCGTTIGPLTAKNSGIRTFDIGNPQLSMHSIRETCGPADIGYMVKLLTKFLENYPSIPQPEY